MKNSKWIQFIAKHGRRIIAVALVFTLLLSLSNLGTIRALIRQMRSEQNVEEPTPATTAATRVTEPTQPAETLTQEEQLELALTYLTAEIQKDPNDPELFTQRAAVNYNLGKLDEAIEDYTAALSLKKDPQTRYLRAIVYTATGQSADAYLDLKKALNADPDNKDYLSLMSDTCYAMERYGDALVCLEKLIADDPDNCVLRTLAGDACVYLGNYESAVPHYQQAIACYSDDAAENGISKTSLYSAYGNTLKNLNLFAEAAEVYTQSMELEENKELYFQRGFCYLQGGSYAEAIADFTTCIEQGYEVAYAHFQRALCYCATNNYLTAIDDFTIYETAFPEKTDAYLYLAICYQNLGQYYPAITYYGKCIQANIAPGSSYFNMGNCYYNQDDYSNAIASYTTAIAYGEYLYESLLNRGICYIQLNKYNEAKADLKRVMDECPDPALVESATKSYEPIKNITIVSKK